jgi:hypothetical protein
MQKQKFHYRSLSYACTVVGCHLLCLLGLCLARGVVLQLFEQTYHRLLSAFGTSVNNAYSISSHLSSGLNAKAKFHCTQIIILLSISEHITYTKVFIHFGALRAHVAKYQVHCPTPLMRLFIKLQAVLSRLQVLGNYNALSTK